MSDQKYGELRERIKALVAETEERIRGRFGGGEFDAGAQEMDRCIVGRLRAILGEEETKSEAASEQDQGFVGPPEPGIAEPLDKVQAASGV